MYTNVRLHRLDFVQFMCGYVRLSAHFGETEKAKKPYKPYIKISVGPTLGSVVVDRERLVAAENQPPLLEESVEDRSSLVAEEDCH